MTPNNYIVTGPCQSRKTWTSFALIDTISQSYKDNIDCIFVSQANNARIVQQTLGRLKDDPKITSVYTNFVYASGRVSFQAHHTAASINNTFYVGFWHKDMRKNIVDIIHLQPNKPRILVVDEAEQGGIIGTFERLLFVKEILKLNAGPLHIILVTATIANLSKCVLQLVDEEGPAAMRDFVDMEWQVRHVDISADYVGMQWYLDHGLVKTVQLPKGDGRREAVIASLSNESNMQRSLALVCAASRIEEHRELSNELLRSDLFNVTVELNSSEMSKVYSVNYISSEGSRKAVWNLPFERIVAAGASGKLASVTNIETGEKLSTHWSTYGMAPTMPYILQACLRLGTSAHNSIKETVATQQDWASLMAIFSTIERPHDYPKDPKIAVISGNMVNRGMTLTSSQAAFVYTLYFFADSPDAGQRGASNAQRAGRSYGNLLEACTRVQPVILTTCKCLHDALSNEKISADVLPKTKVTLASFVSEDDWDKALRSSYAKMETANLADDTPKKKREPKDIPAHDIKPLNAKRTRELNISNLPLATTYDRMILDDFVNTFVVPERRASIANGNGATHPRAIAASLVKSIEANLSFADTSAAKVANLRNYYTHPEWSGKEYHFIWSANDQGFVRVIRRNKDMLNAQQLPTVFAAHNEYGQLVGYATKK